MEGMRNKYPRSARSTVEEYIIEDRLANMSVESGERGSWMSLSYLVRRDCLKFTHIEYQNVQSRVNGATNIDTLFLTAGE